MRRGVVRLVELDVAVAPELGYLPDRHVIGRVRERLQTRLLDFLEPSQGLLLFGSAVDAQPGSRVAPPEHVAVRLCQRGRFTPAQEVALDVVHAALLDFAFVLRRCDATGRDQKAIVRRAFTVRLLHVRIILYGAQDRGLQIVDHDPSWNAAEKGQRIAMQSQPGLDFLVQDELDVLMPAP